MGATMTRAMGTRFRISTCSWEYLRMSQYEVWRYEFENDPVRVITCFLFFFKALSFSHLSHAR